MTKVTLHYPLTRPLDDSDLDAVANVHGYYGIVRVKVAPSLDAVAVDFDASRLSADDVEAALQRYGLPVSRT